MRQNARRKRQALKPHELALAPEVHAFVGVRDYAQSFVGEMDDQSFLDGIHAKIERVTGGDLVPVEAMLIGQAESLQSIFTHLTRRAFVNLGSHPEVADTFLRLALKAQSQCRASLETLAEIKSPRAVAFVKQANIAHGPQQVNNAVAREESVNAPNKLLEARHGDGLECRAQSASGSGDPALEAMAAINRPKDG